MSSIDNAIVIKQFDMLHSQAINAGFNRLCCLWFLECEVIHREFWYIDRTI